jgi:hypothetical protein
MMQPQPEQSGGAASELRNDAERVTSSAANRLHSEIDARKGDAASQARSVSSAIGNAAGGLDESAPAWLRSAFQQGAQQIQRLADTLEQKDSREIVGQVNGFARERPGLFLTGCAAAGFAAARIFRAGAAREATRALPAPGGTSEGPSDQNRGQFVTTPSASQPSSTAGEYV